MGNCCEAVYTQFRDTLASGAGAGGAYGARSTPPACGFDKRKGWVGRHVSINRMILSGTGVAVCDTPQDQMRLYWEAEIKEMPSGGRFTVGVVRGEPVLKAPPNDRGFFDGHLGQNGSGGYSRCFDSVESGRRFNAGDVIVSLFREHKLIALLLLTARPSVLR